MKEINGEFDGEIKIDSIRCTKMLTRTVTKNNDSSGKVTVPREHIDEKVIILFPKKVRKK